MSRAPPRASSLPGAAAEVAVDKASTSEIPLESTEADDVSGTAGGKG